MSHDVMLRVVAISVLVAYGPMFIPIDTIILQCHYTSPLLGPSSAALATVNCIL